MSHEERVRLRRLTRGSLTGAAMLALVLACSATESADAPIATDTTAQPTRAAMPGPDSMTVQVWFAQGEDVVSVTRRVAASPDTLAAALRSLLAGPTEAERQQGLTTWFSSETASALRDARLEDGMAVVDLHDLRSVIPNASTSLGSTLLLTALNATVFGASAADSVEYRFDGSCEVFGEFVQRGCIRYARGR